MHNNGTDQQDKIYVEVAVFAPLANTFTYHWPSFLGPVTNNIRVQVPFGKGQRIGLILQSTQTDLSQTGEYKSVMDRLDDAPLLNKIRNQWIQRIGRYYLALPGELWSSALGWAGQYDLRRFRCPEAEALQQYSPQLAELFHNRSAISLKKIITRNQHIAAIRWSIMQACKDGVIEELLHPPAWDSFTPNDPVVLPPSPTDCQQTAIESIINKLDTFQALLLFGCTGSGKTEVYLRAALSVIQTGGQVLVLVPEIGLTPLWLTRLNQRFERVALWHSAMTPKERLVVRQHLDQTQILIGTRSALFLPLRKLAMIVVDEEHDGSFKQQEGMAYSARDMAVLLAQQLNIPIVLGSATPSLESWKQVKAGIYQRLDLPHRIASHAQPIATSVIDMRNEEEVISKKLYQALKENLQAGEQSILFLNRRGYSQALQCTACGDVPECSECSIRLTLHRRAGQLRCHSCGIRRRVPMVCATCGEQAFLPLGEGTEKLDEWLTKQLPDLRFARFDRDVITSHNKLKATLTAFEHAQLDCLIGTQMLVKGHDFPNVTLVGVINADLGISMPDFRAGERWWQQMTQVTGRAGRGSKPGQVIIQTRMPEANWFDRMAEAQAESTMNDELKLRQLLSFPPFARWVRLIFSAKKFQRANEVAQQCANLCKTLDDLSITGPMACPLERIAGKYRVEVLLRDSTRKILPWKLESILANMDKPRDVRMRIDVDPQDMM